MDRGAWQATVHEVTKSWTWLSIHTHILSLLTVLSAHPWLTHCSPPYPTPLCPGVWGPTPRSIMAEQQRQESRPRGHWCPSFQTEAPGGEAPQGQAALRPLGCMGRNPGPHP